LGEKEMPGLLSRILPRELTFFDLFALQAENVHRAAGLLAGLFENYTDVANRVQAIKELEHQGDTIIHDLMTRLNQTFITPIDREDIHALSSKIDDVLDLIDAAANRLVIYRVDRIRPQTVQLARVVPQATEQMRAAVRGLEKQNDILRYCREMTRVEKEADRICRQLIAELFEEETHPVEIIKWKEIIEVLEASTDKVEDVANVLEAVALKSS
jgi:predicted phosphate transport protein (TIGR00153 family)